MAKAKLKAPALTVVPQSVEECDAMIRRIGEVQREMERRQTAMNDDLAARKAEHEAGAAPFKSEKEGLLRGVQAFCESRRADLTNENRVKFHRFPAGEVSWRARPPAVSLRKVADIIETCLRRKGFDRFLRIKHEVDKEAMLKEPAIAVTIPGVAIGSAGEEFAVKPFETELEEVA